MLPSVENKITIVVADLPDFVRRLSATILCVSWEIWSDSNNHVFHWLEKKNYPKKNMSLHRFWSRPMTRKHILFLPYPECTALSKDARVRHKIYLFCWIMKQTKLTGILQFHQGNQLDRLCFLDTICHVAHAHEKAGLYIHRAGRGGAGRGGVGRGGPASQPAGETSNHCIWI